MVARPLESVCSLTSNSSVATPSARSIRSASASPRSTAWPFSWSSCSRAASSRRTWLRSFSFEATTSMRSFSVANFWSSRSSTVAPCSRSFWSIAAWASLKRRSRSSTCIFSPCSSTSFSCSRSSTLRSSRSRTVQISEMRASWASRSFSSSRRIWIFPSGVPIDSRRGAVRRSFCDSASSSAFRSAMEAKVRSRNARSSSVKALRRSRRGSRGGLPGRRRPERRAAPSISRVGVRRASPVSASSSERSTSSPGGGGGRMPWLIWASSPISKGMVR